MSDASCHTLAAALLQDRGDGQWKAEVYASRKLTDAEHHHEQIDVEAFAIT